MFYTALRDDIKSEPGFVLVDGDRFLAIGPNKELRFRVKRVGDTVHFEHHDRYTALLTDVERRGATYMGRYDCVHKDFPTCRVQGRFAEDKPLRVHDVLETAFATATGQAISPGGYRGSCPFFTQLLENIKNHYREDVVLFADDTFVSIRSDKSIHHRVQLFRDAVVLERPDRYTARLTELQAVGQGFSGRYEVAFCDHASCSLHGSFKVDAPIYVHGKISEALMVVKRHADELALF